MGIYAETMLGYRTPLLDRATKDPLLISSGNIHCEITHVDSVMAAVYGWKRLSRKHGVLRPSETAVSRI